MKRAIMLVAASCMLLAPLAADIVVKSPNGGEPPMAQGTKWMISWTAANVSQQVRILLIKGAGGKFGTIKEPLEPGASPWEWTVGQTDAGMAPAGEYKVRITTLDGSQGDISNANFTITSGTTPPEPPAGPESLTVTSPNGGEEWAKLGGSRNITWTAVNFAGHVDLVLKRDGKTVGAIARKLPAGQGTHPWKVGELLEGKTSGLGGGFKVRVVKNYEGLYRPKGGELADESDGAFSIVDVLTKDSPIKIPDKGLTTPVKPIVVTNPREGFVYTIGQSALVPGDTLGFTLIWETHLTEPFKIYLFSDAGSLIRELVPAKISPLSTSVGFYAWVDLKTDFAPPGYYKIKVQTADGQHSGFSGVFQLRVVDWLRQNLPDLIVCKARPFILEKPKIARSVPGELLVWVHNKGTKKSPACNLRIAIEGSAEIICPIPELHPSHLKSVQYMDFRFFGSGPLTYTLQIDPEGQVQEQDENNNIVTGVIPRTGSTPEPEKCSDGSDWRNWQY